MVAIESVYQIRIMNMSPIDIIDNDDKMEAYQNCTNQANEMTTDIINYIYDKYCNKEKDSVSMEVMKVQPLEAEDLQEY